jgi:hypothetical protein
MPRYYFDTRDDGQLIADDEGPEFSGDDAARDERAAASPIWRKTSFPVRCGGTFRSKCAMQRRNRCWRPE